MTATDLEGPGGDAHDGHGPSGRLFWPAVALGWVVMTIGAWGLISDADKTQPGESARFVLGAAVVHDLLLAPFVVLAGWALAKVVPPRARGPVQAALIVSAVVALFSIPFVRGYGRVATNPSILPRNYIAGLGVILVATWVIAGFAVVRRWWRGRSAATEPSLEPVRSSGETPPRPSP